MSPEITALMCELVSACEPSCSCFHSSCHPTSLRLCFTSPSPLSVSCSIIVRLDCENICSFLYHYLYSSALLCDSLQIFNLSLLTFLVMLLVIQKMLLKREKIYICMYTPCIYPSHHLAAIIASKWVDLQVKRHQGYNSDRFS